MRSKSLALLTLLVISQLAGCYNKSVAYQLSKPSNEAKTSLSLAADSISKSLAELAEIERHNNPQAKMYNPVNPNAIGMPQIASIDWNGPIEPLVKKIAESSKFKVNVLGTSPGIPILVSISAKDTPISDILRNADYQCGKKANIVVYPANKIIELRYTKS